MYSQLVYPSGLYQWHILRQLVRLLTGFWVWLSYRNQNTNFNVFRRRSFLCVNIMIWFRISDWLRRRAGRFIPRGSSRCVKRATSPINYWSFTNRNRWWRGPDKHGSAKKLVGNLFLEKPFYLKLWLVKGGSPSATGEISLFFSLMLNRLYHGRLLLFTIGCQGSFCLSHLCVSLGSYK